MKKHYLILMLAAVCTATPLRAAEDGEKDDIEADLSAASITVSGTQVHVKGAAGQALEIYNLAGVRVATLRIDTDEKTLNLNLPRGCYMLKVGKVVRKIALR